MKKVLLVLIMLLSFQCVLWAQIPLKESDVPEVVKNKLPNLFPGITDVQWTKHNTDYQASFMYDNIKVVSKFAESGRWINSESEYKLEDCPRSMQKHITTNFPNTKLTQILLTETKDLSEYRVELTDSLSKQSTFAIYDISGSFIRKADSQGNDADLQLHGTNEKGKLAVHPKELPSAVNSYIIINYPQHTINESSIVNNEKYQNAYYIILGKSDEKNVIELWFDYQGTPIISNNSAVNNDSNQNGKDPKKNAKKQTRVPFPQNKVPASAVTYFMKKEPKAEDIQWDTIAGEYVVSYYNPIRSVDNRMYFNNKGAYIRVATIINPKDLLPMIQNYLAENYPNLEIESAENVIYEDKKKYTIVRLFGSTWMNDPMVFHEIYFSTSGRLEKEKLANFIDAEDEYLREKNEAENGAFNDYTQEDDLSMDENDMVDGQPVTLKELPSASSKYLSDHYPDYNYTDGMIINDENVLKYSVFIKREGYKERKRILFDLKGKFLKEEDI